jgi:hypothetical protein
MGIVRTARKILKLNQTDFAGWLNQRLPTRKATQNQVSFWENEVRSFGVPQDVRDICADVVIPHVADSVFNQSVDDVDVAMIKDKLVR